MRISRLSCAVTLASCLALSACQSQPPQPAQSTPSSAPVKVKMLWWGTQQEERVLNDQIAGLGLDVEVEKVAADEVEDVLAERVEAGDTPDIVRTLRPREVETKELSMEWDFVDEAKAAATDDGSLIAAPYDAAMTATYVNSEAFARAGVDVPPSGHPWRTWEHLIADAERVKDANGMANAFAISNDPQTLAAFFGSYDNSLMGKNPLHVSFDGNTAVKSLKNLKGWVESGVLNADVFPKYVEPDPDATPTPSPSASPSATPKPFEPATATALQLFEQGKVPVVIVPARTPAPSNSVRVDNPCQEVCGGLPQFSYLAALTSDGVASKVIEALTSVDADSARVQATGGLPVHPELIPQDKQGEEGLLGEYARLSVQQMSSGLSPITAGLTDWPGEQIAKLLADEATELEAASQMREVLTKSVKAYE